MARIWAVELLHESKQVWIMLVCPTVVKDVLRSDPVSRHWSPAAQERKVEQVPCAPAGDSHPNTTAKHITTAVASFRVGVIGHHLLSIDLSFG